MLLVSGTIVGSSASRGFEANVLTCGTMKNFHILSCLTLLLAAAACKTEPTSPEQTFRLTATLSGSKGCVVNAPDTVYRSAGLFTGDQPNKFVSTYNTFYHGFWCWVSVDGGVSEKSGAANIFVAFSGNTFGKPLAVGNYGIRFDILEDTPAMMATVRFQALNLNGDEYRPLDNSSGSIVVDSTADGTRTIRIDVPVIRYSYHL